MIRLAIRLLPWGLCAVALLFGLVGLSGLLGTTEEAPTAVAAKALTAGDVPKAQYLKITGGVLYWPAAITHYVEKDGVQAADRTIKAYLVPMLDPADAERWSSLPQGAKRPDIPNLVYASFTPAQANELFPDVTRGEPKSETQTFEPVGTVTGQTSWPGTFSSYVESSLAIAPSRVLLLEHGGVPLQKSSAAVLLGMGVIAGAMGGLWLKKRRDAKRASLGGGVRDGVASGLDAAFASARSQKPS